MLTVFFALTAALSAVSGLGVVLSRRPLYSALSLVVNMLSLALLFVVLSAQFLAAAQVIVYAGAVMVLFVFVIALLNPARDETAARDPVQLAGAVVVAGLFTALAATVFLNVQSLSPARSSITSAAAQSFGSIQSLGTALYRDYAFPFEMTSLVLLAAAVGAVYLSRGR